MDDADSPIDFADFLHDAELDAAGKLDGYRLSSMAFSDAVIAAARVVEAVREVVWMKDGNGNVRAVSGLDALEDAVREFA